MDSLSLLFIPAFALILAAWLVFDTRRLARQAERAGSEHRK